MRPLRTSALLALATLLAGCGRDVPTGLASTGMLTPANAVLPASSGAGCENVRGAIEGNFAAPAGFTLEGLGNASVTVEGLDFKGSAGQATIFSVTTHRIETPNGALFTSDEGVLAPIDPPLYRLNHRWTIVGGTEDFEGATGFLQPHALIDLGTGDIEGFFVGRICT